MSRSRESSLGSVAMEEEEDDLYGTGPDDAAPAQRAQSDDSEEGEEDDEDEDDESDIEIVTERPDLGPEPTTASRTNQRSADTSQPAATTSSSTHQATITRAAPTTIRITADTGPALAQPKPVLFPGAHYPAIRTSANDLDLDNVPLWEGKPITELDIDADLAEAMKPWRRPGADQSDYFNYGFDEFSWAMYCEKQKAMRDGISEQKEQTKQMEQAMAMMGGAPPPGMPGAGGGGNSPMPGAGGMPGMPSEAEVMNMTMQYMQANNIQDISQVDFGAVMQFMGAGGGGMPMGPGGGGGGQGNWGQQDQGGYGGGGGGRGGRRGRGRW